MRKYHTDLFRKVVEWMKDGGCVLLSEYEWLHINRNISRIFIFISHISSLVEILSFFRIRAKTEYVCACKHSDWLGFWGMYPNTHKTWHTLPRQIQYYLMTTHPRNTFIGHFLFFSLHYSPSPPSKLSQNPRNSVLRVHTKGTFRLCDISDGVSILHVNLCESGLIKS